MGVSVQLLIERGGGLMPLCRTRRPELVARVAGAALADLRASARRERDPMLSALAQQDIERLEKAFATLGIATPAGQRDD